MAMPHRLQTCRYWALGPRCPDITPSGITACPYAHWDTGPGRLCSHLDQPGTCAIWRTHGSCVHGVRCHYEHRECGYLGVGQTEHLELDGLALQVADAAKRAGFDTANQVALLDLIWAVKRIVVHRVGTGATQGPPPPPKHAIYPDRFRPSGVGDNTKRPRPALKRERGVEIKQDVDDRVTTAPRRDRVGPGTQYAPITIDSDDEDGRKAAANSSAKRQKTSTRRAQHGMSSHRRTRAMPRRAQQQAPPTPTGEHQIMQELDKVKVNLQSIVTHREQCMVVMKQLFDSHAKLRSVDVRDPLVALRDSLVACEAAAQEGTGHLGELEQWLTREKENMS